ncbi:MAG: dolichol kinase [Leptospiraceae bacterium]|nr:dolichol kinase [Leptospiraceae bacterium]MCP5513280.1 dolichol kinase [Leptospiraceae bacterium]
MDGFNFKRKLFHFIGFFVPGILYFDTFRDVGEWKHSSRLIVLMIILVILIGMSVIEFIRLRYEPFNEFYLKLFGKLMKKDERHRMNGVIPYMISNAFIVSFFPSQIIFLSMAFLLIGDPVAAYFGAKYGKYRFSNGKSALGVVAFIIGSSIAGFLLMLLFDNTYGESFLSYSLRGSFNGYAYLAIFIGAVSAAIAEMLSGHAWKGFLEDNLLIPVVASIVLAVLSGLFGLMDWNQLIFPLTEIFATRG